jgi:hypothetical protein
MPRASKPTFDALDMSVARIVNSLRAGVAGLVDAERALLGRRDEQAHRSLTRQTDGLHERAVLVHGVEDVLAHGGRDPLHRGGQ